MDNQGALILARLDRLPIWPFGKMLIIALGVGFFFAFFDIITIGLALPILAQQFHVPMSVVLLTITMGLIGYIVGSFIDARISDLFGRRLALFISIALFSIGSLLSAFSPSISFLIVCRFIIGLGLGSEIANVTTYIAELCPASCRGKISSYTMATGFFGFAVVPFVGIFLVPMFSYGWRILFLLGSIGGAVTFVLRRRMPPSIRWLVNEGRLEEANHLINDIEAKVEKKLGHRLAAVELSKVDLSAFRSGNGIKFLFKPPYLGQLIFFACTWFVYYIGNYAWLTISTDLFYQAGFTVFKSIWLTCFGSLGFIAGSFFCIYISDRVERKWTLTGFALIWTVVLLLIAFFHSNILIMISEFIGAMTISSFVPLMYTYVGESFPTSFRSTGVALTDGFGHLGGAFCGQIIFFVAAFFKPMHLEFQAAFCTMALSGLITAILLLFGKRMTKKPLAQ